MMECLNSEVGIIDEDTQNKSKQNLKIIDTHVLCNSFNAAISDIYHKRKGKFPAEEEKEERANFVKEQFWPVKKMKKKRSSYDFGNESLRGPFDCSSSSSSSGEECHINRIQLPPMHLMLNTDFIVTSPLKQDLMLTLALTDRKRELEKVILVGHFRALLSFKNFGLGPDAMRVRTEANAGGTSTISEALSVEYFVRRFQAKDIVTEMEVEYCIRNWKKVDYICTLYGQQVGVSVTRAMCYPDPHQFSSDMATRLLYKKLFGLVVARDGVADRHCFSQCILHVWCETERIAKLLEAEYAEVSQEMEVIDDVIMVLTVADGLHAKPIFYEHCLN